MIEQVLNVRVYVRYSSIFMCTVALADADAAAADDDKHIACCFGLLRQREIETKKIRNSRKT